MDRRCIWGGSEVHMGWILGVSRYILSVLVWPGYAPVWGLFADLLEQSHSFDDFSFRALKLLANHKEQLLMFFGFLYYNFGVSRSLA